MSEPQTAALPPARKGMPPLRAGEALDQKSFHERYEAMPPDTRAELIGGVVIMPPTLGPEHFPTPPGTPQLPAAGPGPEPQVLPPALPPAAGVPTPAVAPAAPAAPVMPPPVTGPAPMAGPVIPPAAAPPPVDAPPAGTPHLTAPPAAPLIGEQFGPLTVTTPGATR